MIDLTGPDQQQVSQGILPTKQEGTSPTTEPTASTLQQAAITTDPDMTGDETPILPQKRPFESMYTLQVDSNNIKRPSPWTDGSPDTGYGPQHKITSEHMQQHGKARMATHQTQRHHLIQKVNNNEPEAQHNASRDRRPNNSTENFLGVKFGRCQRPTSRSH